MIDCPTDQLGVAFDLLGFSAGIVLTLMFLAFVLRSARLTGMPSANIVLGACAFLFNAGGLGSVLREEEAFSPGGIPFFSVLKLTAAMAWPIPALVIWREQAALRWQKTACTLLAATGAAGAVTFALACAAPALFGLTVLPGPELKTLAMRFISASGFLLAALGIGVLVKGRRPSREVWLSYVTIVFGAFGIAVSLFLYHVLALAPPLALALDIVTKHLTLVILLGSFFLFARFRLADVFIRHAVRILIASVFAAGLVVTLQVLLEPTSGDTGSTPSAATYFAASGVVALAFLAFAGVDGTLGRFVGEWMFRAPDYREATRQLADRLQQVGFEAEIGAAAMRAICDTLEVRAARLVTFESLPAPWQARYAPLAELVELRPVEESAPEPGFADVELLVPVASQGRTSHVIVLAPGKARRALVSHELGFLRAVAAQIGQRFDSLRSERAMAEQRSREARLHQQISEAELRALRAQINPHFLFNSLNTIADLVVTDPLRAETMTLRLAQVFRHVLMHSSRPLTSVREEIDFVGRYLFIEEARFGDRLKFEMDVSPDVAAHRIPSLILQPLVENSLKHGLAPKPGRGHLWIKAALRGTDVCLTVEDDGVGAARAERTPAGLPRSGASGVGLRNVAERLQTLYQNRATFAFEPRATGGTRVTLRIPAEEEAFA